MHSLTPLDNNRENIPSPPSHIGQEPPSSVVPNGIDSVNDEDNDNSINSQENLRSFQRALPQTLEKIMLAGIAIPSMFIAVMFFPIVHSGILIIFAAHRRLADATEVQKFKKAHDPKTPEASPSMIFNKTAIIIGELMTLPYLIANKAIREFRKLDSSSQ